MRPNRGGEAIDDRVGHLAEGGIDDRRVFAFEEADPADLVGERDGDVWTEFGRDDPCRLNLKIVVDRAEN